MKIDAIDLRILAALQGDGRLSNQDLADKVSLSPSACLRRVRTLEEFKLIRGYHAELDAVKLGFDLEAVVHVTLDRAEADWHGKFQQRIQQFDEVTAAYVVSGACNYVLHVRTRSLAEFSRFIVEKLNKVAGVRDLCSYIVMQKIKDTMGSLPLD
ncbi:MAG: Lrp/AsnC family transcriptional regulator [Betaproteobacteria bacterium]|nr:MAG: Lrp/AsnC family transcriptional regulator [Betaproteobacteria bacterium]